jgi:hypothetical protein
VNNLSALQELLKFRKLIDRVCGDQRLSAMHISLFTALFLQWHRNSFIRPFAVTRRDLMARSKIASPATYHKCMKQLEEYGYIRYQPSYHPQKGSLIGWPEDSI